MFYAMEQIRFINQYMIRNRYMNYLNRDIWELWFDFCYRIKGICTNKQSRCEIQKSGYMDLIQIKMYYLDSFRDGAIKDLYAQDALDLLHCLTRLLVCVFLSADRRDKNHGGVVLEKLKNYDIRKRWTIRFGMGGNFWMYEDELHILLKALKKNIKMIRNIKKRGCR